MLELIEVSLHGVQGFARGRYQFDALAEESAQHFVHALDDVFQVEHPRLQHLLAAEGQELSGKRSRAFTRYPPLARLVEFEGVVADEFAERRRVLRYVKRVLKEESMYDVLTKRVREQPYVSRSKHVKIRELVPFICEGFDAFGEAEGGRPFVLYHGSVTVEDDGPVEVCMPKRNGDKRLPAGDVAFTEISGNQCDFPEILGAYEAVYRWAKENGREPDGPAREIYLNEVGEDLHMEIAVPLR